MPSPTTADRPGWLFVIGDRAGLEWVLSMRRMAFVGALRTSARSIQPGDVGFVYATKKIISGPVGRVIAAVEVTGSIVEENVTIEGWLNFRVWCPLRVLHQVQEPEGIAIKDLVNQLKFIKQKDLWPHYLRRGLVHLPPDDARLLLKEMQKIGRG